MPTGPMNLDIGRKWGRVYGDRGWKGITGRLLSCIAMVFQDVYLFKDGIINNIRFGNKDATKEEVIAAAKAAHCHEFIEGLPDGYNTVIGEGGATLSGGEKQRISIASPPSPPPPGYWLLTTAR